MGIGKRKTFRLSESNWIKFQELHEKLLLDNPNRTMNSIIERFWEYEKFRPALEAFKVILKELKTI